METWRDIEGYEGLYMISNIGRVKSLSGQWGQRREAILRPSTGFGYKKVILFKNGIDKTKKVHRLVAQAFIPNPENKPCINHKNRDRGDNKVENLEWCTYDENNKHAREGGVRRQKGAEHHSARPVLLIGAFGEIIKRFETIKDASDITGVCYGTVVNSSRLKRPLRNRLLSGFMFEILEQ